MNSNTLTNEINELVQGAIDEGRDHLSDDEAFYLIKISEKLVQGYVRELQNLIEK